MTTGTRCVTCITCIATRSFTRLCASFHNLPRTITYHSVASKRTSTGPFYHRHSTPGSTQLTTMYPYKFSQASQKKDMSRLGVAFGSQLKKLNFDATTNAVLNENTPRRGFDSSFSQPPLSRHVEPHALGSSVYPRYTPEIEIIDNKPSVSATVSPIAHFSISSSFLNGLPTREYPLDSRMSQ